MAGPSNSSNSSLSKDSFDERNDFGAVVERVAAYDAECRQAGRNYEASAHAPEPT